MFDVDRLNEALKATGLAEFMLEEGALPVHVQTVRDAARLVVAGQPLWWCAEHGSVPPDITPDFCQVWHLLDGDVERSCRMVEGWWMPTGTSE